MLDAGKDKEANPFLNMMAVAAAAAQQEQEAANPKPPPPKLASVPFSLRHRVVLQMNNLVPEQAYHVEREIFDAAGVSVVKGEDDHLPDGSTYLFWWDVEPKIKAHKPGQWTAKYTVQGVGTLSWKYTVLPPTESETKILTGHEAARDVAFAAFAHYWRALDDSFMCSFGNFQESKLPIRPRDTAFEDPGSTNAVPATLLPTEQSSYLEIAGLRHVFSRGTVTEADFRNGITYRGQAVFLFTTFRVFTPDKGWSPWYDVPQQQDFFGLVGKVENPFAQILASIAGVAQDRLVETPSGILNLRYEMELRDKNWFVRSDSRDSFVNRKRTFVSSARVVAPPQSVAKAIRDNADDPRKRARAVADAAARSAGEIVADMDSTVSALRQAQRHP